MRRTLSWVRVWIAVATLTGLWLGRGIAYASIDDLRFTTSFSFIVDGKVLPPGTYEVHRVLQSPYVFEVTSTTGRSSALMTAENGGVQPRVREFSRGVLFEGAHNQYVLRSLWDESFPGGVDSITSHHDLLRVLERKMPTGTTQGARDDDAVQVVQVPADHR